MPFPPSSGPPIDWQAHLRGSNLVHPATLQRPQSPRSRWVVQGFRSGVHRLQSHLRIVLRHGTIDPRWGSAPPVLHQRGRRRASIGSPGTLAQRNAASVGCWPCSFLNDKLNSFLGKLTAVPRCCDETPRQLEESADAAAGLTPGRGSLAQTCRLCGTATPVHSPGSASGGCPQPNPTTPPPCSH